jgi:hypothetical protein
MVSYITRSALRDRTRDLREGRRAQLQKASSSTNSTFLSHSSKDADLVEGASQLLAEYGASVCIDRVDNSLLDLSRFCAAPLITYCAAKGMNHGHRQDG